MDEAKKEKLNALSAKVKENAAQSSGKEGDGGAKRGLFGFGSKPTNNDAASNNAKPSLFGSKPTAATNNNSATTTNAKPSLFGAKPTAAATSAKPTATAAATTTAAKPTATASAKPTATASAKPTSAASQKKSPFTDVLSSAYYADAVAWAVDKKITSGTTPTTFSPGNPCHRGHVATFLWRSKGSPEPKSADNPFTDVAADSPFYKAILWATQSGIVEPKSAKTYEPTAPCTRGEVLKALYRAEGKSGATEADAVKWANLKKLLAGFAGGADVPCTRADIVTFLYRVKTN